MESKDHDLLIRIDERTQLTEQKVSTIFNLFNDRSPHWDKAAVRSKIAIGVLTSGGVIGLVLGGFSMAAKWLK